jgi:hypothetical protein
LISPLNAGFFTDKTNDQSSNYSTHHRHAGSVAFSSGLHLTTGGWHRIQQLNSNNALLWAPNDKAAVDIQSMRLALVAAVGTERNSAKVIRDAAEASNRVCQQPALPEINILRTPLSANAQSVESSPSQH